MAVFIYFFFAAFAASISALIASRFAVFLDRDVLFFPTPVSRFAIIVNYISLGTDLFRQTRWRVLYSI